MPNRSERSPILSPEQLPKQPGNLERSEGSEDLNKKNREDLKVIESGVLSENNGKNLDQEKLDQEKLDQEKLDQEKLVERAKERVEGILRKMGKNVGEEIKDLPERIKNVFGKFKEFWDSKDSEQKKKFAFKVAVGAVLLGVSIPLTGGLSLIELVSKITGAAVIDKLMGRGLEGQRIEQAG